MEQELNIEENIMKILTDAFDVQADPVKGSYVLCDNKEVIVKETILETLSNISIFAIYKYEVANTLTQKYNTLVYTAAESDIAYQFLCKIVDEKEDICDTIYIANIIDGNLAIYEVSNKLGECTKFIKEVKIESYSNLIDKDAIIPLKPTNIKNRKTRRSRKK